MDKKYLLNKNIFDFARTEYLYSLLGNLFRFGLIFIILWLSIVIADMTFHFSKLTRWGLFFINIPIIIYLLNKFIFKTVRQYSNLSLHSDLSLYAQKIGLNEKNDKDNIINIYQLCRLSQTDEPLKQAAIEQGLNKIVSFDFRKYLNIRNFLPGRFFSFTVILAALVMVSFNFDNLLYSTKRLLIPGGDFYVLPPYSFTLSPGNSQVYYGEPLNIKFNYTGPEADQFYFYSSVDQKNWDKQTVEKTDLGYNIFIKEAKTSFYFQVRTSGFVNSEFENKINSDIFYTKVLIPPRVNTLDISVTPPRYSRLAEYKLEQNNGNFNVLPGSTVFFKLASNKVLQNTNIIFSNGDSLSMVSRGKTAEAQIKINEALDYTLSLKDTSGLKNINPIRYNIGLINDNPPFVEIFEPGEDIEAQLDDLIQVSVKSTDDFGLNDLYLKYRYVRKTDTSETSWKRFDLNGFQKGFQNNDAFAIFNFSEFFLRFDDQLEYFAEAIDNNPYNRNVSRSSTYRISFPSVEELLDEFNAVEKESLSEMENLAEESENLKEILEKINREMRREKKIDWETQKEVENAIKNQQQIQKKLDNIQKEIEDVVNKLEKNNLMSKEILDKYQELQKLFKELASPELLEAMRNLNKALEEVNQKDVDKAMAEFKQNQEIFKQNLERTLELLKQVQLEQKIEQLEMLAERLSKKQDQITEKIDQPQATVQEEIKRDLDKQKSLLDNLKNQLDQTQRNDLLEKFASTKEKLENTQKSLESGNPDQKLNNVEENLHRNEKGEAIRESREIAKLFSEMQQQFNQALDDLRSQHKQNIQQKMLASARKMLQLSFEQEKLQKNSREMSQLNDDIKNNARKQAELKDNLEKVITDVISLSKETFFVNPDLLKGMAGAYQSMQSSLAELSERRSSQAAAKQQKAMESLNQGIQSLQNSLAQMSQSQSGTGFEQFMQQLQQMAKAQGGLNSETMDLFSAQGDQGSMGMQQQAEAKRLAAQQKALQQAMNEMADEMGNRQDVLGRMGELSQEMEEVIQDLVKNNVNRKTIQRQQQILSRMLDAQKSVREREFSKKREGQEGLNYIAQDPKTLKDFEIERQKILREALKKALSEGYYSDYKKLIDAYFQNLSRKINQN